MATATSPRLTKPRISALILEGTALSVSLVLVLWLLLWFMWRSAGSGQIEAFFVPSEGALAEEVLYQSIDIRRLRGSPTSNSRWETKPSELLEVVKGIVSEVGQALVIYVAAPVVAADPRAGGGEASLDSVIALIKTVASESKRDVVLALDLAQIDSDRDLGVFGNSPYQDLAQRIREIPVGQRSILILTSCAPAQKSWSADGLGQSAFSYYLRKGLQGEALEWEPRSPGMVTSTGLHRYVLAHVSAWARKNCRANQTPMLIPVGNSPTKVALPRVLPVDVSKTPVVDLANSPVPTASSAPGEKQAAKDGPAPVDKEKSAPHEQESSPRDSLFKELLSEWKKHDGLRDQQPPPYRYFPGEWRFYQSTLIQAERRLRAAWHDSDGLNPSSELLSSATDQRVSLEEHLKKQSSDEDEFPFHPGMTTKEGKKEIEEALAYLTGIPMGGGSATLLQPTQGGAGKGIAPPAPRCLRDVAEGGYPRYLELQLPVWASLFAETFRRPEYFKNSERADQLTQLVEERSKAEQALALDRRGTRYVKALIESGDRDRRQLQDQLFAASSGPGGAQAGRFATQINRVKASYDAALSVIKVFHEAREVLEKIAAELPDLAEWSIRSRSHAMVGDRTVSGDPMTRSVENMIESVRRLIQVLDQETPGGQGETSDIEPLRKWSAELKNLTQPAREALQALENDFEERTRPEIANDWVARDLALRSPLLRFDRRTVILKRVLDANEDVHVGPPEESATEAATEYPRDPGFWVRAAGLAELDLALHQVSRSAGHEQDLDSRRLRDIWSLISSSSEGGQGATDPFKSFSDISGDIRQRRGHAAAAQPDHSRDSNRTAEEIEQNLRLEDRVTRFLPAGEIRQRGPSAIDGPVADYERFGQYVNLVTQLDRLGEDFVYVRKLDALWDRIENLGKSLGMRAGLERQRASQSLKVEVIPPGTTLKIEDRGEVSFQVGLSQTAERIGIGLIPKGRAFIGLVRPKDVPGWDVVQVGATPDVPGTLVELPPPIPPPDPILCRVIQDDLRSEDLKKLDLEATVFYRGRVDAQGKSSIVVAPKFFKDLVVISITHDPEVLKNKYGEDLAALIKDQFKDHQSEAYMHQGKDLDYILSIKSVAPRGINVRCQRFLLDSKAENPTKVDEKPLIKKLNPGERIELRGRLTSQDVPLDNHKYLRLTVKDEHEKDVIDPLLVKFKQMRVNEYMEFKELAQIDEFEGQRMPCYVVKYIRKITDPVTEPILGSEISCTIEGRTGKKVNLRDDFPIFPGEGVKTTHPSQEGAKQWKWSGKIEGVELPDKTVPIQP